MAGITSD